MGGGGRRRRPSCFAPFPPSLDCTPGLDPRYYSQRRREDDFYFFFLCTFPHPPSGLSYTAHPPTWGKQRQGKGQAQLAGRQGGRDRGREHLCCMFVRTYKERPGKGREENIILVPPHSPSPFLPVLRDHAHLGAVSFSLPQKFAKYEMDCGNSPSLKSTPAVCTGLSQSQEKGGAEERFFSEGSGELLPRPLTVRVP